MGKKMKKQISIIVLTSFMIFCLFSKTTIFAEDTMTEDTVIDSEFLETKEYENIPEKAQKQNSDVVEEIKPNLERATNPVRIQGTTTTYATLKEAVDDISTSPIVLEITDDIVETSNTNITINANVTLIAVNGSHTITMVKSTILVANGNSLILGDGIGTNVLTINSDTRVLHVTNGNVEIKDGIELSHTGNNLADAVRLNGPTVTGSISGGIIGSTNEALYIGNGAQITEISGGQFYGHNTSLFITDQGTEVGLISGGVFQNDVNNGRSRANAYLDHNSKIGEISGGEFIAFTPSALLLIRGGSIEHISGGNFTSKYTDSSNTGVAVQVSSQSNEQTSIGKISDGNFSGDIGLWVVSENSYVSNITGGTFSGKVGLEVDTDGEIDSIGGATITGINRGILNVNKIGEIKEDTVISGSTGIWNYGTNSHIGTISGGIITGTGVTNPAIKNEGTIDLISAGTFIGEGNAIDCYSMNGSAPKTIQVISGGNFYGKSKAALNLGAKLILEPSLDTIYGLGRYSGKNGVIFNDESLVQYPSSYYMSTVTKSIADIPGTEFKYLTQDVTITYMPNGGTGDIPLTTGEYNTNVTVSENKFTNGDYPFIEWNTQADGKGISYEEGQEIALEDNLVLYAQWQTKDPIDPVDPIEPIDPVDPIDPKEPTNPIKPNKPVIKEETLNSKNASKNQLPKTGDTNIIVIHSLLAGLLLSGAYLVIVLKTRKSNITQYRK